MSQAAAIPITCPLSDREQTRNVLIVGVNTALCYLCAPVLYVDVIHTSLLDDLQRNAGVERSAALSNSPMMAYMIFAAMPLFVSWLFPQIRLLRPILVFCYFAVAMANAAMVVVLLAPLPFMAKVAIVILHGAVTASFRCVSVAFEFEVLGVAVAEARRGQALGIAYGFGPILAILANLFAQLLLTGNVGFIAINKLESPENFAAVFFYTVPVLLLCTFLCTRLVIPLSEHEPTRKPFFSGVFGGIGDFLGRRVTLLAAVSSILVFCGYQVIGNMNLYSGELYGTRASELAGYQKAILYTCKVMMGLSMGWLLTWAAPRSAVLIGALAGLSAIVLAFFAPPAIFLLSFGLLGAGQLHGIYATNYILSCAPKHLMRKYMAFAMLLMLPAAPFSNIYGEISDVFGKYYGPLFGYRMSFVLAATLVLLGITLVLALPGRPKPQE